MEMTKEWLLQRCKAQNLYRTPELNDSLFLQCQAFCEIQNLDEYTGVKKLHLDENCIESLNGVQPLKQLQCLYLRKNVVRAIDHLQELTDLDTLDLSHNCLAKLDNLSKCLKLRVLVVSHNLLDTVASIEHLTMCPSLMVLDLSHNKFKDGEGVLGVAKSLASLTVLYLSGNPFVAVFTHYRKKLIGTLAKLNHLDDRPVFWDERRYAEAWMRGGAEEESRERDIVREMRAAEETLQFEAMRLLRSQHMEERKYVASRPLLQFTPDELGEDVESLLSPPDALYQASPRKIELQDVANDTFESIGLRPLAYPAKLGEDCIEGDGQALKEEYSSTHSYMECNYFMEHDSKLAQDQNQHWRADNSMEYDSIQARDQNQQWEAECSMEHNTMLAQDRAQQCRAERCSKQGYTAHFQGGGLECPSQSKGRHRDFCTSSPKVEANSIQDDNTVQIGHTNWPAASSSKLQDLGIICSPVWEPESQLEGTWAAEHTSEGSSYPYEEEPSKDHNKQCEQTDIHEAPLPPQQQGSDSFGWNHYYNNPSFCGGQHDDNLLHSLQGKNHTQPQPNRIQGTLSDNPCFCGQQINNFPLSIQRMKDIEPNCTHGTLSSSFQTSMNVIQKSFVEEVGLPMIP